MELVVVIVVCVAWWAVSRHADLWRAGDGGVADRASASTPVLPPASTLLARDPDLTRDADGAFVEGYVVGRYVGERRTIAELADAGLVPAGDRVDLDDVDLWTVDAADLDGLLAGAGDRLDGSDVDGSDVDGSDVDGFGDGFDDHGFDDGFDDGFD